MKWLSVEALYGAVLVTLLGLGVAAYKRRYDVTPSHPNGNPVWADSALGSLYGVRVGPSTACFVLVTPRGDEHLACVLVDFGGAAPTSLEPEHVAGR